MGYEDLKVLDDLRKSGAITEDEYQQQKQRIFDGAVTPQPAPATQGQPYGGGQPGQQYGGQQHQPGQQYQQAQAYTYPPQQPRSTALFGMSENNYMVLMHISQFAGFIIPFVGYIAPVVLWLLNKDASVRVDATGKRILNFILSFLIYTVVSGILTLILLGFLLLAILGVMWLVFIIVAAVKASSGEDWDYPLAIKFFR